MRESQDTGLYPREAVATAADNGARTSLNAVLAALKKKLADQGRPLYMEKGLEYAIARIEEELTPLVQKL